MPTLSALLVIPVAVLGAIIGSFLNVVIYRLPRGLSVGRPLRSFCPACGHVVRWHDNVPVLSWLALGGRCRDCRAAIPPVYPVVELLSALLFVMAWDALFVGRVLGGIGEPWRDWPAALAWLTLLAGLLACSAMDIEEYLIDVRVTNTVIAVGVAGAGLWGALNPVSAMLRPAPTATIGGLGLLAGWGVTMLLRRPRGSADRIVGDATEGSGSAPIDDAAPDAPPAFPSWSIWALAALTAACMAAVALDIGWTATPTLTPAKQRALAGLFVVMVVLVLAGMAPRPADVVMEQTIQRERPRARGVAWAELALLAPAALAGAVGLAASWQAGWWGSSWADAAAQVGGPAAGLLAGLSGSAAAAAMGAAIGWFVRIFFTLVFGKEAYGVGDIHLMAAIGAVGGVWLVLISFFLGAVLALVGVVAFALRKSSRALPFGPWLSLGALAGLWVRDDLVHYVGHSMEGLRLLLAGGP